MTQKRSQTLSLIQKHIFFFKSCKKGREEKKKRNGCLLLSGLSLVYRQLRVCVYVCTMLCTDDGIKGDTKQRSITNAINRNVINNKLTAILKQFIVTFFKPLKAVRKGEKKQP